MKDAIGGEKYVEMRLIKSILVRKTERRCRQWVRVIIL